MTAVEMKIGMPTHRYATVYQPTSVSLAMAPRMGMSIVP